MKKIFAAFLTLFILGSAPAFARVDIATLPRPDGVELIIYNGADLTLVRETREIVLEKGANTLRFSWAGTLIDPTSLELRPLAMGDKIWVQSLEYPPNLKDMGLWRIESQVQGPVAFEVSYFTSGLSWRAFYEATLAQNEKTMSLDGFVRVENRSGADFVDAKVRLVVGRINLLDRIADLARRSSPYGRPDAPVAPAPAGLAERREMMMMAKSAMDAEYAPPAIEVQGFSEYFLYTIEGKHNLQNNWGQRLSVFSAPAAPVVNDYQHDDERLGAAPMRFLSFINDKAHSLGQNPLPEGELRLFGVRDELGRLSFLARSKLSYSPVGGKVRLLIGPAQDVLVEVSLMDFSSDNYSFNKEGDISGWSETKRYEARIQNTRPLPVSVEVIRRIQGEAWSIKDAQKSPVHQIVDKNTVRYILNLAANQALTFGYTLSTRHGEQVD
ncbi:MAG: DUF4139 domain-containing protein [Desulfatibacillaceae bacterium]|nr:DUF4139 domain-containing protein [Desulfatibacillaceae bacterium]